MFMRTAITLIFGASLLASGLGIANAHSALHHSTPAANEELTAAPATVDLWFSRSLEPSFSTVTVQDKAGKQIDKGDAAVKEKDGKLLQVSLPELSTGTYKVIWRIVALDGHKSKGEYSFSVK